MDSELKNKIKLYTEYLNSEKYKEANEFISECNMIGKYIKEEMKKRNIHKFVMIEDGKIKGIEYKRKTFKRINIKLIPKHLKKLYLRNVEYWYEHIINIEGKEVENEDYDFIN